MAQIGTFQALKGMEEEKQFSPEIEHLDVGDERHCSAIGVRIVISVQFDQILHLGELKVFKGHIAHKSTLSGRVR